MNSSLNISIIDDAPTPPQSNKQSNERKTRRNVIVISSDEEGPPTTAENKISDLEFTIKRLKRENRKAKKAQDDIEKVVARYADDLEEVRGELEEVRQHANRRKIENSKLNDDLMCVICESKMWYPFILPDCGHIFCEGCIREWFGVTLANYRQEHPDFHRNTPIRVPDVVRQALLQTYIERQRFAALTKEITAAAGGPVYSCPMCRGRATTRPVEVYQMKSIVRTVGAAMGENIPRKVIGRTDWDFFFPPPPLSAT